MGSPAEPTLWGVEGIATADLDVTPALDEENLQRLAEALHALGATIRVANHSVGPIELPPDGRLLARTLILNLHLPGIGDVDVIHEAARATDLRPPLSFAELEPRSTEENVPGGKSPTLTMSEEDWVAAKRASPMREKDVVHLDLYLSWRAERRS